MITFVTGIYGAGKTTLAKRLGGRYVSFDAHHDYQAQPDPLGFLSRLADGDVVDAIPFGPPGVGLCQRSQWSQFLAWAQGRDDVRVVCVACTEPTWRARVGGRADSAQWCRFWVSAFGYLPRVEWWSSEGEARPVSAVEAMRLVELRAAVRSYVLDHPSEHHDTRYQDVPEIGWVGYSESHKTWATLAGLIDWRGKRVVDAGCFHGYFSLRALERGAAGAVGLDQSGPALAVARCARALSGAPAGAGFRHWVAGQPIPEADVFLCLNAVHHFGDAAESILATSPAPVAIYECGTEWEPRLRQHYARVAVHPSHRSRRAIYLCER